MTSLNDTSVAEEYRYIKEFDFSQGIGRDIFADLVFSDSNLIKFDSYDCTVRLKQLTGGFYSTAADIWFRTWVTNPKAARELLMIQVKGNTPLGTSWQVRMFDGTNHLFWDSSLGVPAWAIAGVGDWNDEATINAHLDEFPLLPNRRFAVVVNLVTTDRYETPSVREILVLTKIRIDYLEDLVFRSLFPAMKAGIRPVGNFPLPKVATDGVTTFNLNNYELETPFNIVDVVAVYNFTNDGELLYNLLDSYNPTTKVITVTTAFDTNDVPFVLFRYEPELVFTTQQDYIEVSKVPSLIIQGIEVPTQSAYNLAAREGIVDKGTGDAVVVYEPFKATIEFKFHATSDRAVDEMRMMSAIMKFFEENKTLRSVGLDEIYQLFLIREFRDVTQPAKNDIHETWTRFQIVNVRMPLVSQDAKGIMRVLLNFSEPEAQTEDPILGGNRIVFQSHKDDSVPQWIETFEVTE